MNKQLDRRREYLIKKHFEDCECDEQTLQILEEYFRAGFTAAIEEVNKTWIEKCADILEEK